MKSTDLSCSEMKIFSAIYLSLTNSSTYHLFYMYLCPQKKFRKGWHDIFWEIPLTETESAASCGESRLPLNEHNDINYSYVLP